MQYDDRHTDSSAVLAQNPVTESAVPASSSAEQQSPQETTEYLAAPEQQQPQETLEYFTAPEQEQPQETTEYPAASEQEQPQRSVNNAPESPLESIGNDNDFFQKMDQADSAAIQASSDDFENVEEFKLEPPPLPQPICSYSNGISGFCFSQQGESHLLRDTPCQDRCKMRLLEEQSIYIVAIADGVGSCELSDFGADAATDAVVDYLYVTIYTLFEKEGITKIDKTIAGRILREALQAAFTAVEEKAAEIQQILYSLQSTLTVAIYDGTDLYFGHAGDDGIVALTEHGELKMVTMRHKGEESSSVYPLQNKSTWQFGMVNDVAGFVMATDGVLDSFVSSEAEENRIYYPFIEPIFTTALTSQDDVARLTQSYFEMMKEAAYRQNVRDDLTLACVVNQEKLKTTVIPTFDKEEWNRQSTEYARKRRAALYPDLEKSSFDNHPKKGVDAGSVSETGRSPDKEPKEEAKQDTVVNKRPELSDSLQSPFVGGISSGTSHSPQVSRESRPDPSILICPHCNFRNARETFCRSCGKRMIPQAASPENTPANEPPKSSNPPSAKSKAKIRVRCPYCKEVQPLSEICRFCHRKLEPPNAAQEHGKEKKKKKRGFGERLYGFLFSWDEE